MYKKIIIILIIFFSSLAVKAQKLEIYTEQSKPAHYIDKAGNVTGNVYEFVRAIQRKIGSNDKVHLVPWNRAYKIATDPRKKNVLLFSTTFTEERRKLFKWVGPIDVTSWIFYAKKNSKIKIKKIEDAKKVNGIGCYLGDVREAYLRKRGFENLVVAKENHHNFAILLAGRIDLWIASYRSATMHAGKEFHKIKPVFTVKRFGLYLTFHKNTSDKIVKKWQKAYTQLRNDGTLKKIYSKYNLPVPFYKIPPVP